MKRYFFDIEYAGRKAEDQQGTVLTDAKAASQELLAAVIETAAGSLKGENDVIRGSVHEEGGAVFFECRIELQSKWLS